MSDNQCPRCGKAVYFAEEKRALGKKWHKMCLKCAKCNKMLDSTTCTDHDGEVFCKSCYGREFGPKGYGFSGGGAGLSMDTGNSQEISRKNVSALAQAQAAPLMSNNSTNGNSKPKFGSTDMCAVCGKAVYFAEKVPFAGRVYHKICFKCSSCKKSVDSVTSCEREGVIYCRSCYGRQFGPKGYGFAGGAAGLSTDTARADFL